MTQIEDIEGIMHLIARDWTASQPWLYDDAVQEARIRAWQRLEEGYSRQVAQHAAKQAVIDVVRGRRFTGSKQMVDIGAHGRAISLQHLTEDGEYEIEIPYDEPAFADSRDGIPEALAALDPRARRIIWMLFHEDKNTNEIGKELGISGQRVRQIRKASFDRMRSVLEQTEAPSR